MRKFLALLTGLVLALGMIVPAAVAEEAYDPDAIIYLSSTADPTHLDPALATDGQSTVVTGLLFSSLIGYNLDGSIFMDVAESYDVSEDGLTYTFHIRDGIKFTDGTACDADAIVWNWNRVIPANATADMSYSQTLFGSVASFEAVDPLTFVVTLAKKDSTFITLQGSSSLAAGLISPTAYEADPAGFDRNPVGCGPYKFQEWVSGQYVSLVRNDDYFGGKAVNGGVVVRIIPEASTAVSELMVGGIDYLGDLAADQIDLLAGASNVKVIPTLSTNLSILSFADYEKNTLFSDIRLRQAVCYALDMTSINKALFNDAMENATSAIPTCMQAGAEDYTIIGYDPDMAKQLMTEAGYPDGFEFTLLTYNVVKGYNPAGEQLAVQMQAELAKVGITMNIEILPWAEFLEKMYADPVEGYDAILHGWGADYNDTSNILMLFIDDEVGGGHNNSGYASPEYNAYFDAAITASSYEEAGENYHKAAQLLNDDCPVYILGHGLGHMGVAATLLNPEECLGGWGNHTKDLKKVAQ
jgi:peptide/nickel transport system substrate-binding protein